MRVIKYLRILYQIYIVIVKNALNRSRFALYEGKEEFDFEILNLQIILFISLGIDWCVRENFKIEMGSDLE